jgi:hypothetical protein
MYQQDKNMLISIDVQQTLTRNICPIPSIFAYMYSKAAFLSSVVEL